MTDKNLQPSIAEIEAMLSSMTPQPGERYHQHMRQAPWLSTGIKPAGILNQKKAVFAFGSALVILLLLAISLTPVGGVLADQVLKFFTRAQGDTITIPEDQIYTLPPPPTPEPTQYQALLPIDQIPTPAPTKDVRDSATLDWLTGISLLEAQALVDWPLYQPMQLPEDYRLNHINYYEDRDAIYMFYKSPLASTGEHFMVLQGKNLEVLEIAEGAEVEFIPVGDKTAEMVRGLWWAEPGSSHSNWVDQEGVYTVQWNEGDISIQMVFMMNDDFKPAYLDHDQIVAVVQSIAQCPAEEKYTCQLQQMTMAVGFKPWKFNYLPKGFTFQKVDYRDGLAAQWYSKGNATLTFTQANYNFTIRRTDPWYHIPKEAIQAVQVRNLTAEYVRGQLEMDENSSPSEWNPTANEERLRWKQGDYWFQIVVSGGETSDQKQQMLQIAESLQEEVTLPTPTPTPIQVDEDTWMQVYTDLEDVKPLVDFEVLVPTILPEKVSFSHVRYVSTGSITMFFGDFAADLMRSSGPVLTLGQYRLLDPEPVYPERYPPEAIEQVYVNGIPARLTTGYLQTSRSQPDQPMPEPTWVNDDGSLELTWNDNGIRYHISYRSRFNNWRITKEDLIAIAESLQ